MDAFYPYRGAPSITAEQTDNWAARQTISKLLREGAVDLESAPVAQAVDTWSAVKDWTAEGAEGAEGSPIVEAKQGGLF